MIQRGQHTLREILSQPEAWAEALEVGRAAAAMQTLPTPASPSAILFTGCGSTYYLSLAAAALARQRGWAASAAPGSEVWLFTDTVMPQPDRTLLVAISRSGETTETINAVEAFRRRGGQAVVVITCYPDSSLAHMATLTLAVPGAQEQSVAQTRSFASMLIVCQLLVAALAGDSHAGQRLAALPEIGRCLITDYRDLARNLGADQAWQRFFFLGNGPCYGLACEAMLKMKEMSLSYSEAYHSLEFRHGPKSMVDDSTLVIGLLSETAQAQEAAVLGDMQHLGAGILTLSDEPIHLLSGRPSHAVQFGSGLPTADRLVLYLPVLQLLAFERALAKGLDPDGPRNLTAVVTL